MMFEYDVMRRQANGNYYEDTYRYEPSSQEIRDALATILYKNYMSFDKEIRNLPNASVVRQSVINGISSVLLDIDTYDLEEIYEDELQDFFYEDAMDRFRSACDYDE